MIPTEQKRQPLYPVQEEGPIDIKAMLARILRLWPWFLVTLLVVLVAARIYLRYTEPLYQSTAVMMIKDEKTGGGSSLENTIFKELNGGQGKSVENEIILLQSLDLLETVVRRENLFIDIKIKGRIGDVSVYGRQLPFQFELANPDSIYGGQQWILTTYREESPTLQTTPDGKPLAIRPGQWYTHQQIRFRLLPTSESNVGAVEAANEPPLQYIIRILPPQNVAQYFKGSLLATPMGKTSVIALSFTNNHPVRATDLLRGLMDIYNRQGLEDKNQVTSNTIDFLNDRLDVVERELKGVESAVEQYKKNNRITTVSGEAQAFLDQASGIDLQKAEQETRVNILDALERELVLNQHNPRLVPSTLGIAEPSLSDFIQRHNALILQRERLAERMGNQNPALMDLDRQVSDIRSSLLENIKNLKGAYAIAMSDINRRDRLINSRLSSIPSLEKDLVQISRDRNVKEQLYLLLLQKREESAVTLASSVTDSRTVERPRSVGQIKPKSRTIYTTAVLFALLLPVMVLIIRDFFDNKVGDRKEVETKCQAPLLGEISYVKKLKSPIQVGANNRSAVAEQFRAIRTGLSFTGKGEQAKIILITSHRPGEGKSFTSINLGAVYALLNKKVVILEFDLRKPRLMQNLGMKAEMGISNYLSRPAILNEMLVEIDGYKDNLWVLPAGPIPPNPAELISGDRMQELITELSARFDHIIIDSPPFSVVTDATLLQQYTDITLVVLRQGYTVKDAYADINNRVAQFAGSPHYTVLNGVGKTQKYTYYGSRYGSGYRYGYGEDGK